MTYTLPDLPYDYNALAPSIAPEIMELHHSKHHAAYVAGANTALEQLAEARANESFGTVNLLEKNLAFNLGGHVNHSIWWKNLSPNGGDKPTGDLAAAIDDQFGSFDKFRAQFTAAANGLQGSGWAVLGYDSLGDKLLTFPGDWDEIGDVLFVCALASFGLYTTLTQKRPPMHALSFLGFTFGCGALFLIPLEIWELSTKPLPAVDWRNLSALAYVAVFPSILAYLCYNRGVRLIGANRSAPFFHLVPVFGSAMAILFLGEQPHLYHAVGYALVLTGVVIAARKPKTA